MKTVKKATRDLVPGDVVLFADQTDTVLSVATDGNVITVHVNRRILNVDVGKTFFYAGYRSVQRVVED